MPILTKIFGDANKRYLKGLEPIVEKVNAQTDQIAALSDTALRAKTDEFKKRIVEDEAKLASSLDQMLSTIVQTVNEADKLFLKKKYIARYNQTYSNIVPEALAVVREAARRCIGQFHYDVQIIGGIVLHDGQVAEMKTGEGKTLASTLALYINALSNKGVHLVTVNDYLAKRDAVWMGKIFHFLGLSVSVLVHDAAYIYDPEAYATKDSPEESEVSIDMESLSSISRKEAYEADITYGTNNEFGFDYLRDNLVQSREQKVQRPLHYALIDEVDSILIDEARTPLIISAPDAESTDRYYQFSQLVQSLQENDDYNVDEKLKAATLTEQGIIKIEKKLGVDNIYVEKGIATIHHIEQALKARTLFLKDRDYTVKDGEVIIVDEFTGRMMPGRRYSEGLHQAIEAKEGVAIQKESKTMATITIQNYFRQYTKLAGMTGTAETEAEELARIYNLDVTVIPTHKPLQRSDKADLIYKSEAGKFQAVANEIRTLQKKGQPVLVGTVSIEKNEMLGALLEREGIQYNMLNAKNHEKEAEYIAQAGARGNVTVATNMAGRGVDIKLGGLPYDENKAAAILKLGGLHIIGTERHESRRIDNQLRGRAGRQGETGSSQFFVSMEDDLMRIFGSDRLKAMIPKWTDEMPIENKLISRSIESAQKKVEGHNFDIRKHLLEYDDIINQQRMIIYKKRDELLTTASDDSSSLISLLKDEIQSELHDLITFHTAGEKTSDWNSKEIKESISTLLGADQTLSSTIDTVLVSDTTLNSKREKIIDQTYASALTKMEQIRSTVNMQISNKNETEPAIEIFKMLYLRSIDLFWVEHLETINYLRTGIGLRGYGQRDPLVEYKRESRELFTRLLANIRHQFVNSIFKITLGKPSTPSVRPVIHLHESKQAIDTFQKKASKDEKQTNTVISKPKNETGEKIGRNDPCHCGSGMKFKKCHGA